MTRHLLSLLLFSTTIRAQLVIKPETPPATVAGGTLRFSANRPVTWSMAPGSAGQIDADGTYHAPAAIPARQSMDGCSMLPANHIYNTRIDSLPVHPRNAEWMATTNGAAPVNYFPSFPVNTIDKATPSRNIVFYYQNTMPPNGQYQIPPLPDISLETGYYSVGSDNHLVTINPRTCTVEEIYGLYDPGANSECRACSSQGGVKYTANDLALPATGTDAAYMQLSPLMLHANEFAAGGEIRHAMRMTLVHPKCNGVQWPAQAGACASWYSGQVPMGGWARLKSSVNLASLKLSPLAAVLATQLQRYSLVVADAGAEL